jgi:hypothetical protein
MALNISTVFIMMVVQGLIAVNGKSEKPVEVDNEDSGDEDEIQGVTGLSLHCPKLNTTRPYSEEKEEKVQEEEDRSRRPSSTNFAPTNRTLKTFPNRRISNRRDSRLHGQVLFLCDQANEK